MAQRPYFASDIADVGGGLSILAQPVPPNVQFRTLAGGANITVVESGGLITISTAGLTGEANTASNVGAGADIFKQKVSLDLEFRGVLGLGRIGAAVNGDNVDVSTTAELNTMSNVGAGQANVFAEKVGEDFELRTVSGALGLVADADTTATDVVTVAPVTRSVAGRAWVFQHQEPSGTNGGDLISGDWRTRILNTSVGFTGGDVTLASNQITFNVSGTFVVTGQAPARRVENHQTRLQRVSPTAATLLSGSSEYARDNNGARAQTSSFVDGEITVTSGDVIEFQHRSQNDQLSQGFGFASGFGINEVYASIRIQRVAS